MSSLVSRLVTGFPTPARLHSFLTQAAVLQDGDFVALLLFEPNRIPKENTAGLSRVSNDNAQLLRWEAPSLKLRRILKPILAKR